MEVHELKILPEYFKAQKAGKKNFEIRKNDRNYKIGDKLVLKEYDSKTDSFTGQSFITEITFITDYQQKDGYVVLDTKDLTLDVYRRMSELGLIK
ncbi:DUF3850 domain-containing protein [Lactobacillus johnsonii]|uniref:DUF3850 domain-containing protein n=1 Tax=Lactobacillus johnsonii TaxID=33959 RepID=UPI00107E8FE9|nr:DUF3850 domain-containing protein [Lactobacillus johnsonii]TGA93852.1 DUF3850 domain-containing protein [Lactobacillus johnsonii]